MDLDDVETVPEARGRKGGAKREHAPPPPDLGALERDCPITPLGHIQGVYYVFSRVGELRGLTARELTSRAGLASLLEGDVEWLAEAFPNEAPRAPAGDFDPVRAGAWIMRACAARGLWDANMPQRGPGVWRDPADDGLVVHTGDRLLIGGEWLRAGLVRDGIVYPPAPAILPPAADAAPAAVGRRLRDSLARCWRWNELDPVTPVSADLYLGWLGQALLGGAPDWRSHLSIGGGRGTGKSWLARLAGAALGPQAQPATNNFTEAGLRQMMTGEARALVLDEAEHDAERSRVKAVIELLRHMSGGEGARAARGSAAGKGQTFAVTGSACLSAILHEPLTPQDRSRILELKLGPLPEDPDGAARALAAIRGAGEASAGLRARAIAGWPRFLETVAIYRAALIDRGCDGRQADLVGTLLAGRDLLTEDDVPDPAALGDELDRFVAVVADVRTAAAEDGEGQLCLGHLLSSPIDLWRSGSRHTVGTEIAYARFNGPASADSRVLGTIGLRIERTPEGGPSSDVLLVARRHVGLDKLFAGTRWANGVWAQALALLPEPTPASWPKPVRFAGAQSRALAVGAAWLPEPEGTGQ